MPPFLYNILMDFGSSTFVNAPEFPDLGQIGAENLTWLNTSPLSMAKLQGKVVLVDFWTYSCINCQRTLPYLKKWWDKYSKSGLEIIGVHSPEFEFEKKIENVKEALIKYQVEWPVVLDNELKVWHLFANHYWPAKYLIDHEGKIIYTHYGEGNYIETELKIQSALKDAGFKIDEKMSSGSILPGFEQDQTPETYLGSLRGQVINIPQDISIKPNQVYTTGKWIQQKEYLQHARLTDDLDDLIILSYKAKDGYLVMEAEDSSPIKAYITVDGIGLSERNAGRDIQFDNEGRSFVDVNFSTLYHLISTDTYGDHVLRISTTSDKLRCFAFTFGS